MTIAPYDAGEAAALRHCREVTRREARNFYHGLRLSPEPKRGALYAIYAWMRRADDLADDATDADEAEAALHLFREASDAALAGEAAFDDPELVALRAVARRYPLDAADFHDMIAGQLDDVRGRRYRTREDLEEYCRRVASSVGLVCIRIWGFEDPESPRLAVDRGIAFQCTNILRDFVEDHGRGRVYLPEDAFAAHGLDPDALLRWSDPERCGRFVLDEVARAEALYARSAALERMIDPACRPTLWAMTAIYRGILERIRRRPFRVVLGRRVRLAPTRKLAIALRARCGLGVAAP